MKRTVNSNLLFKSLLILIFVSGSIHCQDSTIEFSWIDYYQPAEGKEVGIWPNFKQWADPVLLKELRLNWGFNYVLAYPDTTPRIYETILNSGYDSTRIMVKVNPEGEYTIETLSKYPASWGYYVDEPAEREYKLSWFSELKHIVNQNYPSAKLVTSGYKRNSDFRNFGNIADIVMFSSYKHWWEFLGFWVACCPEDQDQRPDWSDMQGIFGSKFSTTWIGAHRDLNEYEDLLGKARNLGLNSVWLYQHQLPDDELDYNLKKFAESAHSMGFYDRYYQQVRNLYLGDSLINHQFVGFTYLNEIPTEFDHSTMVFNDYTVTNERTEDYFAHTEIVAGSPFFFIVPAGKNASFNTNNSIRLKPGFHAEKGSSFKAYITK
ncbi:3-coathanger stack domain-containing protein [Bacteroidota bacterium]